MTAPTFGAVFLCRRVPTDRGRPVPAFIISAIPVLFALFLAGVTKLRPPAMAGFIKRGGFIQRVFMAEVRV